MTRARSKPALRKKLVQQRIKEEVAVSHKGRKRKSRDDDSNEEYEVQSPDHKSNIGEVDNESEEVAKEHNEENELEEVSKEHNEEKDLKEACNNEGEKAEDGPKICKSMGRQIKKEKMT